MSFMVVTSVLALVLFVLSYLRAGRFGFTVLALGAGYLLAEFWADTLAGGYRLGPDTSFESWRDIVYGLVVLLPGLLVLLFGHKQKSAVPRLIASLTLGLLAVTLLLPVLSDNFTVEAQGRMLFGIIQQNRRLIFTAILLLGLFDVVFSRLPKARKHSKD